MLRPPYTTYNRLYVYHLDLDHIPEVQSPDLIGIWMEDKTAVLFFHTPAQDIIKKYASRKIVRLFTKLTWIIMTGRQGNRLHPLQCMICRFLLSGKVITLILFLTRVSYLAAAFTRQLVFAFKFCSNT